MTYINIGIAQINPKVGDLNYNFEKIFSFWKELDKNCHLVCFPELALTGYPPEDLLLRRDFLEDCKNYLQKLLAFSKNFTSAGLIGLPFYKEALYNAVFLLYKGEILSFYFKRYLAKDGVFDEKRYFKEGNDFLLFFINEIKIGVSICEDIWYPSGVERIYDLSGVEIIISLNASPYYFGKYEDKENFLKAKAKDTQCYVVYVNMVGGQDELIFDGRSLVISPEGKILARAKAFEEDQLIISLNLNQVFSENLLEAGLKIENPRNIPPLKEIIIKKDVPFYEGRISENPKEEEEIYSALKLALKDYFNKNGFKGVILGLSGGIDSALTLLLAVDSLGKEKVTVLFMPSEFTSKESLEDARELAKNLEIPLIEIPITEIFRTYRETIRKTLGFEDFTVAEENLQARIRANLLFYLSNRKGWLVLSTSNKSEAATGYTTIYGDMAGGYAPLKDVYKTLVYKLARYRNSQTPVIPERIFKKAPSAELRPGQTDQDTLPPYEILDEILRLHLEEGLTPSEIVSKGFAEGTVRKVFEMLKKSEYKRKQAPLGPKITKRAFGRDYRMPITNGYF
ncbi:MAG: NAD+ synthase [Caldimicrobium thiodismutans]